jgi:hypothetical protein
MESLAEYIAEYKLQMEKGSIKKAYQGLMEYIMELKTHFGKKFPDLAPGNIYQGYMDMTYFPLFPPALKERKLKIAVVFIHEEVRFEAWLSGYNKQVQAEYWELFNKSGWNKHSVVRTVKGSDSIVEQVLADNPDFRDPASLTQQIESGTLNFIKDIEDFLSEH